MTEAEVFKLAKALATCDGGCSNCVSRLAEDVERVFPGLGIYNATMAELYPDWELDKPVPDWVYEEPRYG